MSRSRRRSPSSPLLLLGFAILAPGGVRAQSPLTCDLSGYARRPDLTAGLSGDVLALEWAGGAGERGEAKVRALAGIRLDEA